MAKKKVLRSSEDQPSKKAGTGNKPKSSETSKKSRFDRGADARRRYILDRVRKYGRVTYKEIEDAAAVCDFTAGYQSHQNDDEFFASYGLEPRLVEGKGMFVLRNRDVGWTFKYRMDENQSNKKAVGMLAAAVLLGRPVSWEAGQQVEEQKDRNRLEALQTSVWNQLVAQKEIDGSNRIPSMLKQYWKKRHRLVAIDAGTTTYAAAEFAANPWGIQKSGTDSEDGLPEVEGLAPSYNDLDPRSNSLRVLTNCPRIERCMESPHCFPRVISVGGALRKDTLARTGILAEQSLSAMNLRPDIAMLGTTSLRTEQGFSAMAFSCDSEEEAHTKRLMAEADLTAILMDSSKVQRYRSSAFTFAACDSNCVDVVITDAGIHEVAAKENIDIEKRLWDSGVALLVAETSASERAT